MALCTDCERVVPRKKLKPKDHNCLLNLCRVCNKRFEPGMHMECYVQLVPKTKKRKRRKNTEGALHDPAMPKHGIEGRNPGVFELLGEMDMDMGYPDADVGFGDATEALEGPSEAPPNKKCPKKEKEPKPPLKTFVADFEAETVDGVQRPNLLCIENEQGEALEPFEGPECGKDFVKALYGNKDWHNSMILFHNGSGYDTYPIMKALYEAGIKPWVIMRDTKNLQVKLPKLDITIRDTFLHIPQSLASMPRAFDFPEMEKGYFPYAFATPENANYVGPLPPMHTYEPDRKPTQDRAAFLEWYEAQEGEFARDPVKIYNIKAENRKYCQNDCCLLGQGVRKYRERMGGIFHGEDPFQCCTLASFCNKMYRKYHMPKNCMAALPQHGWGRVKHSGLAVAYLEWVSKDTGIHIYHARNSDECTVGRYKIDGIYFPGGDKYKPLRSSVRKLNKKKWQRKLNKRQKPVLVEVNGCRYHGHSCQLDRQAKIGEKTMDELAAESDKKWRYLERLGYTVLIKAECEIKQEMEEKPHMKEFIKKLTRQLNKPNAKMNLRDALKGGRTESFRRFAQSKPGSTIRYLDVTSLYPAVNYGVNNEQYPVGHPSKYYLLSFPDLKDVFGLIKGKFLPPPVLDIPFLGTTVNGRFLFGLCKACMEESTEKYCSHSDESPRQLRADCIDCVREDADKYCEHYKGQRVISGTWTSMEIQLALEHGYTMHSIDEIWHWNEDKRSSTIFRDYISAGLKEKTEASGWPPEILALIKEKGEEDPETEAAMDFYIADMNARYNFTLDKKAIKKNNARRSVAKLILNNFWGFLARDSNMPVTQYVDTAAKYFDILDNRKIVDDWMAGERLAAIQWVQEQNKEVIDSRSSTIHGIFTTSHAYGYLHIAGVRALYCDTDSIMYEDVEGEPALQTGQHLGELKDEVLDGFGPDAYIHTYASLGAKCYLLLIYSKSTGEHLGTMRRAKGIRTDFETDQILTADKMIELVKKDTANGVRVPQRTLRRDKKAVTLTWVDTKKVVRNTFTKRVKPMELEGVSRPFGTRRVVDGHIVARGKTQMLPRRS